MPKKTLIERWREEALAPELAQLMAAPVFKRAFEIISEYTEPNDLVVAKLWREDPAHAADKIASIHQMQAGERRVMRMLKFLSEIQPENNGQLPEPFSQYDEQYFETRTK